MKNSQQDERIQNLERNINAKLQNLEDKLKKMETKLNGKQSPSKLYHSKYRCSLYTYGGFLGRAATFSTTMHSLDCYKTKMYFY
jgi:hypothetical protein